MISGRITSKQVSLFDCEIDRRFGVFEVCEDDGDGVSRVFRVLELDDAEEVVEDGNPHDFDTRAEAEAYAKKEVIEWNHEHAAENGDPCSNALRDCRRCTEGALNAGIPLSVIKGETKLTDHFSRQYIDHMCNREPREDE